MISLFNTVPTINSSTNNSHKASPAREVGSNSVLLLSSKILFLFRKRICTGKRGHKAQWCGGRHRYRSKRTMVITHIMAQDSCWSQQDGMKEIYTWKFRLSPPLLPRIYWVIKYWYPTFSHPSAQRMWDYPQPFMPMTAPRQIMRGWAAAIRRVKVVVIPS